MGEKERIKAIRQYERSLQLKTIAALLQNRANCARIDNAYKMVQERTH